MASYDFHKLVLWRVFVYAVRFCRSDLDNDNMTDSGFLARAYALSNATEARTLYDEWANTYDQDPELEKYAFPQRAAEILVESIDSKDSISTIKVVDAGCGTGLVGAILAKHGVKHIDGLDISPGMLEQAKKTTAYEDLIETDLTKEITKPEGHYDAIICVGTLTQGHVGPAVLSEFVRVLKKRGLIVATITDAVWTGAGFKDEIDMLIGKGAVEMRKEQVIGVYNDTHSGGRVVVLEKS